jgi:hypothetical protein
MSADEPSLRDAYARYFFTVLDASLHDDEASRRQAQTKLEEVLAAVGAERRAGAVS